MVMSHFWIVSSLPIKGRLGAHLFMWKLVSFACEWKLIFKWKVVHLASLWYEAKSNSEKRTEDNWSFCLNMFLDRRKIVLFFLKIVKFPELVLHCSFDWRKFNIGCALLRTYWYLIDLPLFFGFMTRLMINYFTEVH